MKVIQKITSVFLALVFLLSSLGFTLNKMTCFKSGRVKVSLVAQKDCCPERESTIPLIKSKCCDLSNTYFNLSDVQHSQKVSIEKQLFVKASFLNYQVYNSASIFSKHSVIPFADLPPPLYGRTLLNFISVLII